MLFWQASDGIEDLAAIFSSDDNRIVF